MGFRFPEPHELADAWITAQEEMRERELAAGTCGTCGKFTEAPDEWTSVRFGWCDSCAGWFRADHPARDCEDDYEAAA